MSVLFTAGFSVPRGMPGTYSAKSGWMNGWMKEWMMKCPKDHAGTGLGGGSQVHLTWWGGWSLCVCDIQIQPDMSFID